VSAHDPGGLAGRFRACFDGLAAIGRDPGGGWSRLAWTDADRRARDWFRSQAAARALAVEQDPAGNLWAWRGTRGPGAVATGSHLDTVAGGGAFDGALGVVAGLLALEELDRRGADPARPLAVVAFADEEGGRFGLPTFGSRVLAGTLDLPGALRRRDAAGVRLADALTAAGLDPARMGPDPARLAELAGFVELHVEQGRGLAGGGGAVGVGTGIWPHGRWRLDATGEADHAGTTRMGDRRDPAWTLAAAIERARAQALATGGAATVGRVVVEPNNANSIPARVSAWLDARAPDDGALDRLVDGWWAQVRAAAADHGVRAELRAESRSPAVTFDAGLRRRLGGCLRRLGVAPVELATAAGHDAGVLAAAVPTAMLFVRNPTGVSHSPAEHAGLDDCLAGVRALAEALEELACR